MVNIVTGEGAVFYWAIEASFGNAGVGMPITATATHQPFNPIEGKVSLPVPYYEQEIIYLQPDLDPDADFIYDSEYIDAKGQFPNSNGLIYHDPFLMLGLVFTRKTATGTWGGGAGTYGKLTGDFVTNAHEDTIMFQYKTVDKDAVTIEDKTLLGIKSEEFRIGFKNKGLLRTWYNLITMNETDNSRDYSKVAAFDDDKWADWAKSTFYRASDCKIYWDDSFTAELTDIKIEDCYFIIKTPQAYLKTSDSLKAQYRHNKNRAYQAEIRGLVLGDTELDEFRAAYSSKTKKNLRLSWDQTANETKFLDIDDAFIRGMKESEIPGAAEVYRVTLAFEGISADFEGNYNNLTDPTGRVTVA